MNEYQEGKIYKIVSDVSDEVYYGSTCKTLTERLKKHVGNFNCFIKNHPTDYKDILRSKKRSSNADRLTMSFVVIDSGLENVRIELVENYPCDNKKELHEREKHYIKNNECVNKFIPSRSIQEYKEDNRDNILKRKKQYRNSHKEEIKTYQDKYNMVYFYKNRIRINQHQNEYYHLNKKSINAKNGQICICACGGKTTFGHKSRHYKSTRHTQHETKINNMLRLTELQNNKFKNMFNEFNEILSKFI